MEAELRAWEYQLNDFDPEKRQAALDALLEAWEEGKTTMPQVRDVCNMHCHTFYSFNGYGYSPTGLAWLGRQLGLRTMGTVDFDVLDGVEEFLNACDQVQLRGAAGLETRVYIPEFSDREINSPGEPGIFYLMGVGFIHNTASGEAADALERMRQSAETRNRTMLARLNPYLDPVTIDYDYDVLPLTPEGNATERHMLVAYDEAARAKFTKRDNLVAFWSDKLELPASKVVDLVNDINALRDAIRSRLMKRGGVGYMAPTPETFPRAREANQMIVACGAIPCATWLDGTSAGEQDEEELLNLLIDQGVGVLQIIPDRNWDIPDAEERERKISNLYEVVELAKKLDLPVIAGTEMNKYGQKLIDDFDSEALSPLREDFMDGAYFLYGHTVLERALGLGYQSEWAKENLPSRQARNEFYTSVGIRVEPGREGLERVRGFDATWSPEKIVSAA